MLSLLDPVRTVPSPPPPFVEDVFARVPGSPGAAGTKGESMERPTFEEVVSGYGAFLRRTLARFGIRTRDIEDLMQETLRAVARGLPAFDPSRAVTPEAAVRGWLFGICARQAASHHRARRRRAEDLRETAELDGFGDGAPSAEDTFLACETSARLHRVLESIEPERRAVIVAYELEGTPMSDVATRFGIPVNTAWNRLRLAREDIRAAWGGRGRRGAG